MHTSQSQTEAVQPIIPQEPKIAIGSFKWFNERRFYGLIDLADGRQAFIHGNILYQAKNFQNGIMERGPNSVYDINETTRFKILIEETVRGPKVLDVLEIHPTITVTEVIPTRCGTVLWYNTEKHFGFIVPDDEPKTQFLVHETALRGCDFYLTAGQRVKFGIRANPRGPGWRAISVHPETPRTAEAS